MELGFALIQTTNSPFIPPTTLESVKFVGIINVSFLLTNLAKEGSVGQVEVSEDFDKMNGGQDAITESERIKRLEQRLAEAKERTLLRQERGAKFPNVVIFLTTSGILL